MKAPSKDPLERGNRSETGQALVFFGLLLPSILAIAAMVLDGGQIVAARSRVQNTVDAAALAAAQDLPDAVAAEATVQAYIQASAMDIYEHEVIIASAAYTNDRVTVRMTARVPLALAQALGMSNKSVSAQATAQRSMMHTAGAAIVPWAIVTTEDPNSAILQNPCYLGDDAMGIPIMKTRQNCILKYGSGYGGGGDFGAIRLVESANGGQAYYTHLAQWQGGIHRIGDSVWPLSGNVVGATRDGVMHRLAHVPGQDPADYVHVPRCWHNHQSDGDAVSDCPGVKRNEMLVDNPDGTTSIVLGCEISKRLVIIPIVDSLAGGMSQPATIRGFALFYLKGMLGPDGTIHETEGPQTNGLDTVIGEFITTMTFLPGAEYGSGPGNGPGIITFVE